MDCGRLNLDLFLYVSNGFGNDRHRFGAGVLNRLGFCIWAGTLLVLMSLRIELDFFLVLVVDWISA